MKDEFMLDGQTFQRRYRKCGGKNTQCQTCKKGEGHGPYWYAHDYGTPLYIGKELPPEITAHLDLIRTQKERLQRIRENREKLAEEARRAWDQATREAGTIDALLRGQHADPRILEALELTEFIFKMPEKKSKRKRKA